MKAKSGFAIKVLFLLGCALFLSSVAAQEKEKSLPPPAGGVVIPGSQLLRISSSIVGRDYDLYVSLPQDYGDASKTYPVLYLLDAQWDFPLVTALMGQQYYDGFVPGIIVVGITWGGKNPDYDSLRARDFTPTNVMPMPQFGNAPKFLAFIKGELVPFIESHYRTRGNDRTLMGSSLGGLFTLYALFHETNLFNRYVLTSPVLGWDNEIPFAYERSYAEGNSRLPVRLFMAVGELEMAGAAEFQKFANQVKTRGYKDLEFETRVIQNAGHSGGKAEGFTRGLQFVFTRPSLKLAPDILKHYAGRYQPAPGIDFEISIENESLVLQLPGNPRMVLFAETESDFYVKGIFLNVHFMKNGDGKVAGFQMDQYAKHRFAQRVN